METKDKDHKMVLNKRNYAMLLIGSILILTGYILMSGEGSTITTYNPHIFSKLRIHTAPILCVAGYLMNALGIIL